MATAIAGPVVTDIRGSVGDVTFGRNRGGLFLRERVAPAQPASDERDACQAALTTITQGWSGVLSDAQRSTWIAYGHQHPLPDRWGRPKPTPGLCGFLRSNVQRYRDETALTALVAPDQPPPPMPAFTLTAKAAAAVEVTGNPNPDVTGTFYLDGTNDGSPYWKLDAQNYWLWFRVSPFHEWTINTEVGAFPGLYWFRITDRDGLYTPHSGAAGIPEVADSAAESSVTIIPGIPLADPPANTRLFAYAGVQVTHGRNYFNGPWRYIGRNTYDGADWTLEPWTVPHWAALTSPGRIFLRLVAVLDDGATSCAGYARTNIDP